nr:MAG TPA: hypothetical protein [Caudoviricetes sp.]DAM44971.1 MAG TPA: hypothetical protein [Caudoviricetes sp.]DAS04460.1 MAG TPA: hypothetical protein [Caudoviricetes sp.]
MTVFKYKPPNCGSTYYKPFPICSALIITQNK